MFSYVIVSNFPFQKLNQNNFRKFSNQKNPFTDVLDSIYFRRYGSRFRSIS